MKPPVNAIIGLLLLTSPALGHAMEAVSVHEPSAFALLGIGVVGLIVAKRYKKKD